ncbi:predicted protein [Arabidopsis lyrata subsp. lyrata]|uniref:Predicted protein n=1 Tax=Arabidopsis lyrata subsp. lyrata TaxID=81972 RepID=D7MBF9_ARALL|nr:predicted protein [Arabidopsis lyrata subsp. lyrata]
MSSTVYRQWRERAGETSHRKTGRRARRTFNTHHENQRRNDPPEPSRTHVKKRASNQEPSHSVGQNQTPERQGRRRFRVVTEKSLWGRRFGGAWMKRAVFLKIDIE